jgi:hypothetical protein
MLNQLELRTIMEMTKQYLECNAEKLSNHTNEQIIENLLELNENIKNDTFSSDICTSDLRELYNMIELSSKVKSFTKPLWISLEHTFFDYMVSKNFLQDMKPKSNEPSLRSYELSRYDHQLKSICEELNDKGKPRGIEQLSLEGKSRDKQLSLVADAICIHFYKRKLGD